jgi:FlaG/FlaF family flagellin (archaellin)
VVLLVAVAVGLASVVALGVTGAAPAEPPPRVHLTASADAATDRLTLTHAGGDTLDPTALTVRVSVDGQRLVHQPPVPFFAADGFRSGPTGPFNNATIDPWTAGERATLRLAATNDPLIGPGSTVTVDVYHGRAVVAEVTTRAGE